MEPKKPWRLDSNARFREVVQTIIGLSTASLVLPITFLRQILGIGEKQSLVAHLEPAAYWAWGLLAFSILAGIFFQYLSAKWARLAWGRAVSVFSFKASDNFVEKSMEVTFWLVVFSFLLGLALLILFVLTYTPKT
jgi:hypothetical protein